MNLQRRLKVLSERIRNRTPAGMQPASEQWLSVLKLVRPWFDRQPSSCDRDAVLRRIDDSVALIEEYRACFFASAPWAYLEYFCEGCVLRLSYSTPEWRGRELAVVDEHYGEQMRQIERIERTLAGEIHRVAT